MRSKALLICQERHHPTRVIGFAMIAHTHTHSVDEALSSVFIYIIVSTICKRERCKENIRLHCGSCCRGLFVAQREQKQKQK